MSPDIIILQFDIDAIDYEYASAIIKLNSRVEKLRNAIVKNGIDKDALKTTDFRVQEERKYDDKKREYIFEGFKATHDVEVEIPFDNDLANAIIKCLSSQEEHLTFRINFGVKDPGIYKKELMENTVKNAMFQADVISKAAGVSLKEIICINSSFSEFRFRTDDSVLFEERIEMNCSEAKPDFTPKDIKGSDSITITWKIE